MKKNILILLCITLFYLPLSLLGQVEEQDSLALVALYDSTDGINWNNNTNWLTGPVSSWYGITVTGNRVTKIDLEDNNLQGNLPSEIGKGLSCKFSA